LPGLAPRALSPTATSNPPTEHLATSSTEYSEYRNDQWHFSVDVPSNIVAEANTLPGGITIQFMEPDGGELFQISAWPDQDLDVALGEEAAAGSAQDQPDNLGIVHHLSQLSDRA
jgi:hypothetical protein